MSTFSGKIEDFPYISLDRFDGTNLNSKVFFLSHCHTDHMVGLYSSLPGTLYTSKINAKLLEHLFPLMTSEIKYMELGGK